ncbi:hypothetical protein BJ165DRAFT_1351156, partial [Panaeolus papilionaceus]
MIPLVIGMPIMLLSNLDVNGGATNGAIGTLKSIRYRTDCKGYRYLRSVVINTGVRSDLHAPELVNGDIACVAD